LPEEGGQVNDHDLEREAAANVVAILTAYHGAHEAHEADEDCRPFHEMGSGIINGIESKTVLRLMVNQLAIMVSGVAGRGRDPRHGSRRRQCRRPRPRLISAGNPTLRGATS
jgi:hypothetical protein